MRCTNSVGIYSAEAFRQLRVQMVLALDTAKGKTELAHRHPIDLAC